MSGESGTAYRVLMQPDVRQMLSEDDVLGLTAFGSSLYPAVIADILDGMEPEQVWKVLRASSIERQAEVLEYIEPYQQMRLVETVEREHLSRLVEVMSPDDRRDLISAMDEDHVEALLPLVAQAERAEIRRLLSYPESSAGSIMTTEYASLPEEITVREAIDRLRQQAPDSETIYYVFVLDEGRRLHGIISLRELILARPTAHLADIMNRQAISVKVTDEQDDAARLIAKFDLIALPVVDDENRLVGIITHDDVLDLVKEEADENAYKQSAMEPLERSYLNTPLFEIVYKRGVWLWFLSIVALGTAKVIEAFDGVSQQFEWMQWFLPLVLASGGNTGSQSATLVIRELGRAPLTPRQRSQVAWRELETGIVLGCLLGLFVWTSSKSFFGLTWSESGVIGATVLMVVIAGSVLGSLLPLIFDRCGMDPAYMSNPLIASLSDNLASVIYFSVAILVLLRSWA